MNRLFKHQQGYTLISLIFILGIVAFFVLLVLKLGPIYLDHTKVINAMAAIEKATDVETLSESDIRASLDKRFNINYVDDVKANDTKAVKITKAGNYLKLVIEYEVVEKIVGNISVLVEFHDVIEVGKE